MGNPSRWRYVVLEGEARARGVAHGEALADRIVESLERADFMSRQDTGLPFTFFVSKVHEAFDLKNLHEEVQHELEGIVEGCHNSGKAEVTFDRLVALNGAEELIDSWWPWHLEKHHKRGARKRREARPRCSAFMAIGSATTDGRIVAAHNSWDRFASGDAYNVVLDIRPPAGKGHRVLMQAAPGWVSSNTDWMLTDAGLVVLETTIGSFDGEYIPDGKPEFVRSRVASQFADSITDWTSLFAENNNAGYVNTWLLGGPSGRHDGETAIACYELGSDPKLKHLEFKTDGYFAGCNIAQSQEIRLRECKDPMQHYDIRGNGARRITLDRLIKQEKVDLDRAKAIISDHTDVYTDDKDTGSSRSVCGHLDRDDGKYGNHGQPPFFPWGANDGKVYHAGTGPTDLTFQGIWGNSCGQEFNPDTFCDKNPQYEEFRGHMNHRPPGATWETFPPGATWETFPPGT